MIKLKLSDYKLKKIILHYCVDVEASKTALLTGINRNTINAYFKLFRSLIAKSQQSIGAIYSELDDTGSPVSVKDEIIVKGLSKRDLKQIRNHPVYGLYLFREKVFSEIIKFESFSSNDSFTTAESDISVTDIRFKRKYDGVLYGMFPRLFLLNKDKVIMQRKAVDSFVIESFWSFCIRRLSKFNGAGKNFYLHLKECEWRWKKTTEELIKELTALIIINKTRDGS